MTKELKNPYVKFIGNNAKDVTGSCNLIKFLDNSILVDCGAVQTNDELKDYRANQNLHKDIKIKTLKGVILTHHHIDHLGMIPLLYKKGANCPFYIPKGTKGIVTIMLQDTVKIYKHDFERYGRVPIYTQDDVDMALRHVIECEVHEKIKIDETFSFTYLYAEHIPKARQVIVEVNNGVNIKKVGFTGDISKKENQFYVNEFEPFNQYLDLVVGECTYSGDKRLHRKDDRKKDIEKLQTAINYAISHKSKVLIPTFANARLQEVLTVIYQMYNGKPPIKILVHTPLGQTLCEEWCGIVDKNEELWKDIMKWEDKLFLTEPKDVEFYTKQKEFPLLILASGGFLKSGSSLCWIKHILPNPKDYLVFSGYASEESNAGKIKNNKVQSIKVDKVNIKNNCKVINLLSFSSHMDRKQLLEYYSNLKCEKVCLVHSNQDSKITFAQELKELFSKQGVTTKVIATSFEGRVFF